MIWTEKLLTTWESWVELMGDSEFRIFAIASIVAFILLLGLLLKLSRTKAAEPEAPVLVTEEPTPQPPPAVQDIPMPSGPPPAPVAMMGTGFDAKPIPRLAKPVQPPAEASPPAMMTPPAPPDTTKTLIFPPTPAPPKAVEFPPPAKPIAPPDTTKTVVIPPSAAPPPAAPPPRPGVVDLGMYEALVRRIAGLEEELKKEPLYLDPLMKRMGNLEKKLEGVSGLGAKMDELANKIDQLPPPAPAAPAAPAEGSGAGLEEILALKAQIVDLGQRVEQASVPSASEPGGSVSDEEFTALKEKVSGLQKILELLAEGPNPPA